MLSNNESIPAKTPSQIPPADQSIQFSKPLQVKQIGLDYDQQDRSRTSTGFKRRPIFSNQSLKRQVQTPSSVTIPIHSDRSLNLKSIQSIHLNSSDLPPASPKIVSITSPMQILESEAFPGQSMAELIKDFRLEVQQSPKGLETVAKKNILISRKQGSGEHTESIPLANEDEQAIEKLLYHIREETGESIDSRIDAMQYQSSDHTMKSNYAEVIALDYHPKTQVWNRNEHQFLAPDQYSASYREPCLYQRTEGGDSGLIHQHILNTHFGVKQKTRSEKKRATNQLLQNVLGGGIQSPIVFPTKINLTSGSINAPSQSHKHVYSELRHSPAPTPVESQVISQEDHKSKEIQHSNTLVSRRSLSSNHSKKTLDNMKLGVQINVKSESDEGAEVEDISPLQQRFLDKPIYQAKQFVGDVISQSTFEEVKSVNGETLKLSQKQNVTSDERIEREMTFIAQQKFVIQCSPTTSEVRKKKLFEGKSDFMKMNSHIEIETVRSRLNSSRLGINAAPRTCVNVNPPHSHFDRSISKIMNSSVISFLELKPDDSSQDLFLHQLPSPTHRQAMVNEGTSTQQSVGFKVTKEFSHQKDKKQEQMLRRNISVFRRRNKSSASRLSETQASSQHIKKDCNPSQVQDYTQEMIVLPLGKVSHTRYPSKEGQRYEGIHQQKMSIRTPKTEQDAKPGVFGDLSLKEYLQQDKRGAQIHSQSNLNFQDQITNSKLLKQGGDKQGQGQIKNMNGRFKHKGFGKFNKDLESAIGSRRSHHNSSSRFLAKTPSNMSSNHSSFIMHEDTSQYLKKVQSKGFGHESSKISGGKLYKGIQTAIPHSSMQARTKIKI